MKHQVLRWLSVCLLVGLLPLHGCLSCADTSYECPTVDAYPSEQGFVSLSVSLFDKNDQWLDDNSSGEIECDLTVSGHYSPDRHIHETEQIPIDLLHQIDCAGPYGRIDWSFTVADIQNSAVGVTQIGEAVYLRLAQCQKGPQSGCLYCIENVPADVMLDVKKAVGGAEPWPNLVSADFVREFEVSFSSGGPIRVKGCEYAVEFDVVLTTTMTASDVYVIPVQICDWD